MPKAKPLAPADARGGGTGSGVVAGSEGAKLAVSARPECSKVGAARAGRKLRETPRQQQMRQLHSTCDDAWGIRLLVFVSSMGEFFGNTAAAEGAIHCYEFEG